MDDELPRSATGAQRYGQRIRIESRSEELAAQIVLGNADSYGGRGCLTVTRHNQNGRALGHGLELARRGNRGHIAGRRLEAEIRGIERNICLIGELADDHDWPRIAVVQPRISLLEIDARKRR